MRRAALIVVCAACVDSGSGHKIDHKLVDSHRVAQLPADSATFAVSLGPHIVGYVGNRVELHNGRKVAPGQSVRVTHYWRVERAPGPGWKVFGVLRGAPGTTDFMYIDPSEIEIAHPVETWQAGELIQDDHDIVVRPDWRSSQATLYVGLMRVGGHAVADRMLALGPNTVDRAIIATTLDIDLAHAPPPPGTVYVPRTAEPITIDGLGMDHAWAKAVTSADFATAQGSPDPIGRTTAKLTWDSERLYLLVQVADSDIFSPYHRHDEPLWKADAVEIFIDADGNRRGYVELQVNPNNATFDSWFATTRAQPGDPSWDSGMVTAVNVRGTPDRAGDSDAGWSAEIAIPWAAVRGKDAAMPIHTPPRVGDQWRLNVVRVDTQSGRKDVAAASWNPITYRDFHALDRMLTVVFADAESSVEPLAALPSGRNRGNAWYDQH